MVAASPLPAIEWQLPAGGDEGEVLRNLSGQKLGRKGLETRARILTAAVELIREEDFEAVTLSAIARRANLGMTTLYLYFSDLDQLLVAVLAPARANEDSFLQLIRGYWPDAELAQRCKDFAEAYYAHWERFSAKLYLRRTIADRKHLAMSQHCIDSSKAVILAIGAQMNAKMDTLSTHVGTAIFLANGIERAAMIRTVKDLPGKVVGSVHQGPELFVAPVARMLELAIRDARTSD